MCFGSTRAFYHLPGQKGFWERMHGKWLFCNFFIMLVLGSTLAPAFHEAKSFVKCQEANGLHGIFLLWLQKDLYPVGWGLTNYLVGLRKHYPPPFPSTILFFPQSTQLKVLEIFKKYNYSQSHISKNVVRT